MLRRIVILFTLIAFVIGASNTLYSFWNEYLPANAMYLSNTIQISMFEKSFCTPSTEHVLYIDNCFYNKYMTFINNEYTWLKDNYNNIINKDEINSLTPINIVIYSDNIPFVVISNSYSLIYAGIPNISKPVSWALTPIKLTYSDGWAYNNNQVVLASDNNYYMAKHNTTNNPTINRDGWNKIEPVDDNNFYSLPNHNIKDYRNPIMNTIVRSYLYDIYNTYIIGDVVFYNNQEWVATSQNKGILPSTQTSWAWKLNNV